MSNFKDKHEEQVLNWKNRFTADKKVPEQRFRRQTLELLSAIPKPLFELQWQSMLIKTSYWNKRIIQVKLWTGRKQKQKQRVKLWERMCRCINAKKRSDLIISWSAVNTENKTFNGNLRGLVKIRKITIKIEFRQKSFKETPWSQDQ